MPITQQELGLRIRAAREACRMTQDDAAKHLGVSRPTKGAGGQSIRLLAGVIVAKPLIALCFAPGGAMLGGAAADSGHDAGAVNEPGTAATAAAL